MLAALSKPISGDSGNKIASQQKDDMDLLISAFEVKCRLRNYGAPITLFGENDSDRLSRLKVTCIAFVSVCCAGNSARATLLAGVFLALLL